MLFFSHLYYLPGDGAEDKLDFHTTAQTLVLEHEHPDKEAKIDVLKEG